MKHLAKRRKNKMTNFNFKNFSIQQEILKRVQREDMIQWSISNTNLELPKYEKPFIKRNSVGWLNLLRELKP